jgi:hypothetical protein
VGLAHLIHFLFGLLEYCSTIFVNTNKMYFQMHEWHCHQFIFSIIQLAHKCKALFIDGRVQ